MGVVEQALDFEKGHIWEQLDAGEDYDENDDHDHFEDFYAPR